MSHKVTIEGSKATPTDRLAPGRRVTVEYTADVRKLIAIGGAVIVEHHYDEVPEPLPEKIWSPGDDPILPEVPESAYGPDATPLAPLTSEFFPETPIPPPGNASGDVWRKFLAEQGIEVGEQWGRVDMIAAWKDRDAG